MSGEMAHRGPVASLALLEHQTEKEEWIIAHNENRQNRVTTIPLHPPKNSGHTAHTANSPIYPSYPEIVNQDCAF